MRGSERIIIINSWSVIMILSFEILVVHKFREPASELNITLCVATDLTFGVTCETGALQPGYSAQS